MIFIPCNCVLYAVEKKNYICICLHMYKCLPEGFKSLNNQKVTRTCFKLVAVAILVRRSNELLSAPGVNLRDGTMGA